jgi:hypothetical protein
MKEPVQLSDRVDVPVWVLSLFVCMILAALFATLVLWGKASIARDAADRCHETMEEWSRRERIARWRSRCEEIARSPEAAAGLSDPRAFIEICMDNAAKEAYR